MDQWKELFNWQEEFRNQHNMSPCQFLRSISMVPCSTGSQYLQHKTRIASTVDGTYGKMLRDALQAAKENEISIVPQLISPVEELQDFLTDNEDELLGSGILSVTIDDDNLDLSISVSYPMLESEIRKLFSPLQLRQIKIQVGESW